MKKVILIVTAILLIPFLFLSIQNSNTMKEIKTEIIIDAPQEKVWEVLTTFEAYPSWNPFIVSIEGALLEGGTLTNTMVNNGKSTVFKPQITKLEQNQSLEWLGKALLGAFKGRHYFILEDLGNNQTKLIHGEQFSGILAGIIMKQIGEDTLRNFQGMNKALKRRAEQ